MIRLIALDLDGTTLQSDSTLSANTKQVLEEATSKGVHVVAASGRSFHALPDCLREIRGMEYAIGSNGASIHRLSDSRRIYDDLLEPGMVMEFLRQIEAYPELALEAFVEGIPYTEQAFLEAPERYGMQGRVKEYLKMSRRPVDNIHHFLTEFKDRVDAMAVIVGDMDLKLRIREQLNAMDGFRITSSFVNMLEIVSPTAGKGAAVAWLANRLGIGSEQVMACGNADNDLDMICYAGVGVAVDNSPEELKMAADYVTADNDHEGVALAIRKFVLEGDNG